MTKPATIPLPCSFQNASNCSICCSSVFILLHQGSYRWATSTLAAQYPVDVNALTQNLYHEPTAHRSHQIYQLALIFSSYCGCRYATALVNAAAPSEFVRQQQALLVPQLALLPSRIHRVLALVGFYPDLPVTTLSAPYP